MIITVLIAPDGTVVARLFGKKPVIGFFALIDHEKYVELRGTAFFLGEAEPYVLAHGYRLEHHDLAELLHARSCVELLQVRLDQPDVATENAALRRERDALARGLAAVPALFQKSAGEIYGHAYAAGHEDERDAQRLEGDWSQS